MPDINVGQRSCRIHRRSGKEGEGGDYEKVGRIKGEGKRR
jgi:hypothetical protein